jgi:uncharacterized protein (TIGR03066 family)
MKPHFVFALSVSLLIPATAFSADDNATKIVGKWEITKSEEKALVGSVIEFTKDGKFSAKVKVDDKEVTVEGTYKVEKDRLITKARIDNEIMEESETITKLTDDTLELVDKDKKVTVLKRKK